MSLAHGSSPMVPLRRILAPSLVLLVSVPALLVLWMMSRASTQAVEDLAGKILTQVAAVIQTGTEAHVRQAHDVLDGIFPERLGGKELDRARGWLREPARFESMAFALTRQSRDVAVMHFGNHRGEYLGIEYTGQGTRVGVRKADGVGRDFFGTSSPGERGLPESAEARNFEPRSTAWYAGAVKAKGRTFTPVQVSAARRELMVSLSQPVYDGDGGVAGVFGVDLYLQRLAEVLRTQRISSRGAAFVVDEKGLLVASSAGDALFSGSRDALSRTSPEASANAVIRESFAALQKMWSSRTEDSVATNTSLQRLASPGDSLLMVQRPFGEALGLRWTLVVAAPESDFTGDIARASRASLGAMALLILAATLAAFAIAQILGRRLRALSHAAGQIGQGEVPVIEDRTRILEVHQLSRVLHDSAQQLQVFRAQVQADAEALQEANDTLEARVMHRTAELAASREEALSAARAKAAFLATMSHEIRTPLNGVVGMSTLLAETPLDAEQRDYLQTIRVSSDQLLAVINDVLDFSKIESGKLELEVEPVSVRGAVEEACDIAATRAREQGLELIIDLAEDGEGRVPAAILGDVTRLRQVLINLINNAVKFTAEGEVAVHVRRLRASEGDDRCVLEFRVTDTGIGIPPERAGTLFEAFTQVDASTTRKYGGTGLGLAICKRLVELMGGRLGVESVPGEGSTFWFTVIAPLTELAPALSVADAGLLSGKHVLVVDDHATNVRILRRQLELWGVDVASADSGMGALEWAETAREPDLIITDMHMPAMDGVALARALKAKPGWDRIPIVLLSSGFMPPAEDGAHLFTARLLKPARQNQLFETLLRCVAPPEGETAQPAAAVVDIKKGITILVADDNAVNLKVACAMLLKLGYEIRTATNGREAVEGVAHAQATGLRLGAILMDVNMPEVDGLEATRQIRSAWGDRAPPIIALTAAASAEDRARCEAAGMHDYLTKPLHVAALAQTLESWLARRTTAQAGSAPEASPVAGTGQAPMDFARLEEFREFDDESLSITREVISLFLADTPARLHAIATAIAASDAAALAGAAHALKGSASNVGAIALHEAAATLETEALQNRLPIDGSACSDRLLALWRGTRQALAEWSSSAS